jgi:VanZ family protein
MLWLPAVLHMTAIFIASSVSDLGPLPGDFSDKSWHSGAYALLGVLFLLPLAGGRLARVTWRRVVAAIALATLYGVTDECHQWFVPGRTAEAMDVVADLVGAAAGVGLVGLAAIARAWGILGSSSRPAGPS